MNAENPNQLEYRTVRLNDIPKPKRVRRMLIIYAASFVVSLLSVILLVAFYDRLEGRFAGDMLILRRIARWGTILPSIFAVGGTAIEMMAEWKLTKKEDVKRFVLIALPLVTVNVIYSIISVIVITGMGWSGGLGSN